ncbi:hypothetical protein C8R42DRAFT_668022 [Lentinula raphanica]|nr:hypothetical protein C8R42DRAFT_668022 [Lentinula raphanica]
MDLLLGHPDSSQSPAIYNLAVPNRSPALHSGVNILRYFIVQSLKSRRTTLQSPNLMSLACFQRERPIGSKNSAQFLESGSFMDRFRSYMHFLFP